MTAAAALLSLAGAAMAQSGDVIVMRRVLTAPHRTPTGGTSTPAPSPAPTPAVTPTPSPSSPKWTTCAQEAQMCDFMGTTDVRYGIDGAYVTRSAANGIQCSYQVFGDPAPGAAKHCDYDATKATPSTWVQCADYGQNCVVPAKSVVRMGTNGSYLRKTVTTFVPCTVDAFGGDPAYGLPKTCQYAVIPDQPAVQPPGSTVGTVTSIVIKGGIVSSCLQIGELEVYSSGVNVALASQGAQVSASPSYSAEASADKAIDGIRPSAYPNVYHSQCGAGDYLRVDFAVPMKVDSIVLYGRTDYPSRDVYSYTLYSGATAVSQGQIDARSGSGSASPQ